MLGNLFESNSVYFLLPDAPFDEAGVLKALRSRATTAGATFINVDSPVRVKRDGTTISL
jgi:hypothetical protein